MGRNFISINDVSQDEILQIFELADKSDKLTFSCDANLTAGYSFEGNSIRTRSTFLKALCELRISPIEVPNILKTQEAIQHVAGYLDNWFDLYIIRDKDHKKLTLFSESTEKPTINAMTSEAHPCEVMADVYSVQKEKGDLRNLKFCMIGPPTNVLKSWQRIGKALGLHIVHVMPQEYMSKTPQGDMVTNNKSEGLKDADVVLTDAWPQDFEDKSFQLTLRDLKNAKPNAWVIPCPPFNTQNEVQQGVIDSKYFAGYAQKKFLYQVQKAIIWFMLNKN